MNAICLKIAYKSHNNQACPTLTRPTAQQCDLAPQKTKQKKNKAAQLALTVRNHVNAMHEKLSWLEVKERLACSPILSLNNICTLCKPSSLFSLLVPTKITHDYDTRQALSCHFRLPRSRMHKEKLQTDS